MADRGDDSLCQSEQTFKWCLLDLIQLDYVFVERWNKLKFMLFKPHNATLLLLLSPPLNWSLRREDCTFRIRRVVSGVSCSWMHIDNLSVLLSHSCVCDSLEFTWLKNECANYGNISNKCPTGWNDGVMTFLYPKANPHCDITMFRKKHFTGHYSAS